MPDAVEPGTFFVVAGEDVPRGVAGVGGLEHHVAGAGIFVPFLAGGEIHGAELPLADGVFDSGPEAALLFLVGNFKPIFHELDAAIDDVSFDLAGSF